MRKMRLRLWRHWKQNEDTGWMTYLEMGLEEFTPALIIFSDSKTGDYLTALSIFKNPDKVKYNNLDFEIMYYTGFKDKQGKDIYEGDLVELDNPGITQVYPKPSKYRVVIFSEDDGKFDWVDTITKETRSGYSFCRSNTEKHCKVMGDIYRNPELVEKKGE